MSESGLKHSRIHEYEKRYGPYAFGVGSLLIIWTYVVGPELRSSRGDASLMLKSAEETRHVANSLADTAKVLERTSYQLQAVAETNREVTANLKSAVERMQHFDRTRP